MVASEDMNQQWLLRRAGHYASLVRFSLDEPRALRGILAAAADMNGSSGLEVLLPKILDGALSLMRADFGNVQLLDPASGALKIAGQSGFGSEFLDYFAVVDDDHSACGRSARRCIQTVITDVAVDPGFVPHRQIAAAAGFRAVQSTPLTDAAGRLIGMVSTHWRRPGRPAGRDLAILQLFGDLAGEAVARRLKASADMVPLLAGSEEHQDAAWPEDDQQVLEGFTGEIVHRLFAAGLSLASAQAISGAGPAGDRIASAADELDRAIRDIRTLVFNRRWPRVAAGTDPDW